jgi:hypothetical protein
MPDILLARLKIKGIDPKTGEPVAAEGSHEPVDARGDTVLTTEPTPSDEPATGSVGARVHELDYDKLSKVDRLRNSCGTLLAARELGADITAKALPGVAS